VRDVMMTCTEESSSDDDNNVTSQADHDVCPAGHLSVKPDDVSAACQVTPITSATDTSVPTCYGKTSVSSVSRSDTSAAAVSGAVGLITQSRAQAPAVYVRSLSDCFTSPASSSSADVTVSGLLADVMSPILTIYELVHNNDSTIHSETTCVCVCVNG